MILQIRLQDLQKGVATLSDEAEESAALKAKINDALSWLHEKDRLLTLDDLQYHASQVLTMYKALQALLPPKKKRHQEGSDSMSAARTKKNSTIQRQCHARSNRRLLASSMQRERPAVLNFSAPHFSGGQGSSTPGRTQSAYAETEPSARLRRGMGR